MRSALSYGAASRSVNSKAAFKDATKLLVQNMLRSVTKKLEIEMLYGQVGYGVVSGVSGLVISISAAEWAPGIWAGSENMKIEIFDTTLATQRTGTATITAVDFDNQTITVDAVPTGTVATDVIFPKTAKGNEFAGIHKIITNTGTLFNISAATYNLWKGNSYNASGALSFDKIQEAISKAVEKGLEEDVCVLVNPDVWADLLNDQAALRRYDSSYNPAMAENGAKQIKFHAQNGIVEIIPSIYVKHGYAYVLCMEDFMRVGSTDVTFNRPGKGDEFFRELDSNAGYELRAYCDMALFCSSPGKQVLIYGIS